MKIISMLLAVMLAGVLCTGCGAIFGGSRQTVNVDSTPSSSLTVVQTGMTQNTPTTLSLPRKDNYVLTFEKAGYEQKKVEVQRKMRGGILVLDILFTGLIGVVVDGATGSWYKLTPDNVAVSLAKKEGASSELPEKIEVRFSLTGGDEYGQGLAVTSDEPGVTVRVERKRNSE